MYEKTIAGEHRIYPITITGTPTTVYDLLAQQYKDEYNAILTNGVPVQPLPYASFNNNRTVARTPVDGYIVSPNGEILVRTSLDGAPEICLTNERYTFPVYFWMHKTWVSSDSGSIDGIIRIFFS